MVVRINWKLRFSAVWYAWIAGAVLAAAATAFGTRSLMGSILLQRGARNELAVQHVTIRSREVSTPSFGSAASNDFTIRLPARVRADHVGAELQRTCSAAGVLISSMHFRHQNPGEDRLAQDELVLSINGTYPKILQALHETQARIPNVTMRRISFRQMPSTVVVEASIVVDVWGPPSWPEANLQNGSR